MAKNIHFYDLDEFLVLNMLSRVSMTHSDVRRELIRATDSMIFYSDKYVTGLLFRLTSDHFIAQFRESERHIHYAVTEDGREELQRRMSLLKSYDKLLHPLTEGASSTYPFIRSEDYENAFSALTDQLDNERENIESILYSMTRAAFKAGWVTAEGKSPT